MNVCVKFHNNHSNSWDTSVWTNRLTLLSSHAPSTFLNGSLKPYLNRRPAELPRRRPRWVVYEQRLAVPEASTPGVHPAAKRCNGCLRRSNVILLAVLVGLVPTVVVVMLVVVASVAATLTWTHTGHGAQRAGQLPPGPATGRLRPEARCGAITGPCLTMMAHTHRYIYAYENLHWLHSFNNHWPLMVWSSIVWGSTLVWSSRIWRFDPDCCFSVRSAILKLDHHFTVRVPVWKHIRLKTWHLLPWNHTGIKQLFCHRLPWPISPIWLLNLCWWHLFNTYLFKFLYKFNV